MVEYEPFISRVKLFQANKHIIVIKKEKADSIEVNNNSVFGIIKANIMMKSDQQNEKLIKITNDLEE